MPITQANESWNPISNTYKGLKRRIIIPAKPMALNESYLLLNTLAEIKTIAIMVALTTEGAKEHK